MQTQASQPTTIDEYIAQFPPNIQALLAEMRRLIRAAAPDATEGISYAMPTFYLHGPLVYFAAGKNHIGFYPTPSGVQAFKDELAAYKWSKGAIQFPLDRPLPHDLVTRITAFRADENRRAAEKKPARARKRTDPEANQPDR